MQSGQLFQQLLTVAMERRLEIHSPLASHSHVKPIGDLFSAKFLDHTSLLSFAPPSPFPVHSQAFETSDHDVSAQDQKDQNLILLFQITKAKLNIEIAGHKVFQVSSRSLASTHCSSTSSPSCSRRNSGSTRRDKKPPSSRSWVSVSTFQHLSNTSRFHGTDTEIVLSYWVHAKHPTAGPMGSVSRMHLNWAGKKIEV